MALFILTTATVALAAPTTGVSLGASTSSQTHYGNPANGCRSDEQAVQLQGVPGSFCAPSCSSSSPCPTDVPSGVSVEPQCVVEGGGAQSPNECALVCDPGSDQCGPMECHKVSSTAGICTYSGNPSPSPPSPSPPPPSPSPPGPGPSGFCDDLDDYLPSFCQCKDVDDGVRTRLLFSCLLIGGVLLKNS